MTKIKNPLPCGFRDESNFALAKLSFYEICEFFCIVILCAAIARRRISIFLRYFASFNKNLKDCVNFYICFGFHYPPSTPPHGRGLAFGKFYFARCVNFPKLLANSKPQTNPLQVGLKSLTSPTPTVLWVGNRIQNIENGSSFKQGLCCNASFAIKFHSHCPCVGILQHLICN
ncbi:hypothetical protein DMC01_05800 [Campylobacter troglodytis]|nr:hypothetical protein DMC01_05800 [Campylobacter troglodytis]